MVFYICLQAWSAVYTWFLVAGEEAPDRNNLGEEGLVWAHGSEGYSPSWVGYSMLVVPR